MAAVADILTARQRIRLEILADILPKANSAAEALALAKDAEDWIYGDCPLVVNVSPEQAQSFAKAWKASNRWVSGASILAMVPAEPPTFGQESAEEPQESVAEQVIDDDAAPADPALAENLRNLSPEEKAEEVSRRWGTEEAPGESSEEIAAALGVSAGWVRSCAHQMNLAERKRRAAELADWALGEDRS